MILHADEPGMVDIFDGLRKDAIRRQAGEADAVLGEAVAIIDVDLVAVAVALRDFICPANVRDAAAALDEYGLGTEPHGAAEVALGAPPLELVALHPFRHQPDHRILCRTELGRAGMLEADDVPDRLDHGELHAEANP